MANLNFQQLYQTLLESIRSSQAPDCETANGTPELMLRKLWYQAANINAPEDQMFAQRLTVLDRDSIEGLRGRVEQVVRGVPLAHVLARYTFLGVDVVCHPDSVIPQPEANIVGQAAIAAVINLARIRGEVTALDLNCGCGAIPLAMAYYEPLVQIFGLNRSEDELMFASYNASRLGVCAQAHFLSGDVRRLPDVEGFPQKFDVITSISPDLLSKSKNKTNNRIERFYSRPEEDESRMAYLAYLIKRAQLLLKPNSFLIFTVPPSQVNDARAELRLNPFFSQQVEILTDMNGERRVMKARAVRAGCGAAVYG